MTDQPTRVFARIDGTTTADGERLMTFVASTPGVKRDGLDLRPQGWRTENFERNPVILWAHNYRSLPIGAAEQIDADADQLRIGVRWDPNDAFALQVARKYEQGFLSAVSVGWDWVREDGTPIDFATWWTNTDEELARDFFYDLLELSAVPVPADPDALIERQRAGLAHLRDLGFAPVRTPDDRTKLAIESHTVAANELRRKQGLEPVLGGDDPPLPPASESDRTVVPLSLRRRRLDLISRP